MSVRRCHWIKDKDCPNGRFWMPYCYAGAMTDGNCDCPKVSLPRTPRKSQPEALSIEDRVAALEREVAELRAPALPSRRGGHG